MVREPGDDFIGLRVLSLVFFSELHLPIDSKFPPQLMAKPLWQQKLQAKLDARPLVWASEADRDFSPIFLFSVVGETR